ncbi:hypothetical protein BVRB_6g129400 [Beta vulgaris subsp. vulgaris]|uniref:glycine-rich cell wall structural protein 1.8 n=1 Tax=Beta vulgaris subsp. vulgaris TaxID=3555 RepID=UPI00053FDF67|nr:glycine-rich cell wall structural protein 1.8 [Beta vulgaris subsp. vulgaris]KMT09468.1 hypothetical protein BVRB_6g129400 [Beta vulgaris subsp. vulgaris]
MSSRQTNQHTRATGQGGPDLGAPGTTGAAGARDPMGAPGSTGASRTTMGGATGVGYDPTEYGTEGGGQEQLHRSTGVDVGTGQAGYTYTYGTAASMDPTATGYRAEVHEVHVPHTTGVTGTYGGGYDGVDVGGGGGVGGGYDIGDLGGAGGGVGGVGYDTGERGERAHGVGQRRGGYDTGGVQDKREGQRRG